MAKQKKAASNILEVQNAAKTMLANIRFQSIDKDLRSIMVTSSVPNEGKSTTVWYLAQAAATAGNSVLLIESDMRRRSLANMLQLHPQNGLFSVLSNNCKLSDAVVPTPVRGLYFLDSEPSIPNPADLLASKRMRSFNELLTKEYDYVIYDTPPVGTFVDAAVLGRIVDATILVVRPGRVKRDELRMAYDQLTNAEVNVIGLCSTFVEGTGSEYYYSYYTKDRRRSSGKGALVQVNPANIAATMDSVGSAAQARALSAAERRTAGPGVANQAQKGSAGGKGSISVPRRSSQAGRTAQASPAGAGQAKAAQVSAASPAGGKPASYGVVSAAPSPRKGSGSGRHNR